MGGAMLNNSLIQFSIEGWGCIPSLHLTWGQTMVEVMKIMWPPSKGPRYTLLHSVSPTLYQATADPRLRQRLLDTHGQVWVSLLRGHCSFSWVLVCTRFCLYPPRVSFPVLCKFLQLYGGVNGDLLQEGLCHTHGYCPQSPCPRGSPLLTRTSSRDTQTQVFFVCFFFPNTDLFQSLGPGAHKVCLNPLSISCGYWVWFQTQFCPSYHLAGASSLPLDMGHHLTVTPAPCSCCSSTYCLAGVSLPLDMGYHKPQNHGTGGLLEHSVPLLHSSATNAPTSPPNCQGLKKQEKSDKMAQSREASGERMICCHVPSWMALVLEAASPRARGLWGGFQGGFLVQALSLASDGHLAASSLVEKEVPWISSSCSSKNTRASKFAPPSWPHLNLIASSKQTNKPKNPSPKAHHHWIFVLIFIILGGS